MKKETIKTLIDLYTISECTRVGNLSNPYEIIHNRFNEEIKELKAEINRLRKQLANNHHIECCCSFCKGQ